MEDQQPLRQPGRRFSAKPVRAAAWEAFIAARDDLLITDHHMPKLTGVELLKKLHAAHMAVPVILATGALPNLIEYSCAQ